MCPEQGVLLVRLRDEFHLAMDGYASVFESTKGFESRLVNPHGMLLLAAAEEVQRRRDGLPSEMEKKVMEIEARQEVLRKEIAILKDMIHLKELRWEEILDAGRTKFEDESEHLIDVKAQLLVKDSLNCSRQQKEIKRGAPALLYSIRIKS